MVSFDASTTIQVTGRALITRAVSSSTAVYTKRTVSHQALSHVNGKKVFQTRDNKISFYRMCVNMREDKQATTKSGFPRYWQHYGFYPVCVRKCVDRPRDWVNFFPHFGQQ